MDDIYKNIEEYNPNEKHKIFVFDDMIADMLSKKKLNPIVTELNFVVPTNIRLNSTYYFIMKIPNKRELQQIAVNHSSDMGFRDFMNFYKKCTYIFLFIYTTVASDNPLRFRNNLLERI